MFEKIQKAVHDYYDDDTRYCLRVHEGKLYFLQSNHHNAELFVIICDNSPELLAAIVAANKEAKKDRDAYDGIVYVIPKVMLENGGVKIGEHDD